MPEIARFIGRSEAIELDFVERICTPIDLMELGIQLHLSGPSLSNTVSILESFGVERCRSTVHNWVQKADLEPRGGRDPVQIALDETVVKGDGVAVLALCSSRARNQPHPPRSALPHPNDSADEDVPPGAS